MVRSRIAFTFVELLIVLALIAVLTAIIVPVLGVARRRGQQPVCTSNLHQLGIAIRLYNEDFNERPFQVQSLLTSGLLKNKELLRCKLDSKGDFGSQIAEKSRPIILPEYYPETIQYSYTFFTAGSHFWQRAYALANEELGAFVCQHHGNRISEGSTFLDYEGQVLRLQLSGAVVSRQIVWRQKPNTDPQLPPTREGRFVDLFLDHSDLLPIQE